jgi:hypothetical protein
MVGALMRRAWKLGDVKSHGWDEGLPEQGRAGE